MDRKGGPTSGYEKTCGGNRAERVDISVPERQPMSEPAPTRPIQERKAQHEEIDSDNQEQDDTEKVDGTSVNFWIKYDTGIFEKISKRFKP